MKKKNARFCAFPILLLMVVLCACGSLPEADRPAPIVTATASSTATPTPTASSVPVLCGEELALHAEFAVERFLSQTDALPSYSDTDSEWSNKVLFTAQRDLKNLRFLAVDAEFTEAWNIRILGEKELYVLDELHEGDMVLITMSLDGYLPARALSYEDGCGGTHYFTVSLSGEDNVPILTFAEG